MRIPDSCNPKHCDRAMIRCGSYGNKIRFSCKQCDYSFYKDEVLVYYPKLQCSCGSYMRKNGRSSNNKIKLYCSGCKSNFNLSEEQYFNKLFEAGEI